MGIEDDIRQLHGPPLLPDRSGWEQGRVLHPHIGRHFVEATPGALRVLALGINSYMQASTKTRPHWFAGWFRKQEHRFFQAVARELSRLTVGLQDAPAFAGLRYDGEAPDFSSVYLSNAVRRYLPKPIGRHAHRVPAQFFEEGAAVFRAELDLLAARQRLPHVVVIFGQPWWRHAWRSFGGQPRPSWVLDYQPCPRSSDLYHRLNRVVIREGDNARLLLLVRLTHPAAPMNRWRAAQLVAHPDFAAALSDNAPGVLPPVEAR